MFSFQEADSMKHHEIPTMFAIVDDNGLPRKDLPNTQKDQNGLVKSEWALVKNWKKRIVPMEVVMPEVDDSVRFGGDDIMFAERDVIDSVALDSARNAAQTVRYNNDQRFYNWYFRDKLAWADDAAANQPQPEPDRQPEVNEEPREKKKFFKNLFKKKEKVESDTTQSQ